MRAQIEEGGIPLETTTESPLRERARWTRLATLGLLMQAAGPALMLVVSLVFGLSVSEELPFFLITSIAPLLAALAVWKLGTVGKVIGAIVGFLVLGMLFWTAFGLMQPTSFFEFVTGLLVVPGGLLAIVFSIAALVAGRRRREPGDDGRERSVVRAVLVALTALTVLSLVLTLTGRSTVAAEDAGKASATVGMKDFEFAASSYSVKGGSAVLVRNDDPYSHTFTVDDLGIDRVFTPSGSALIEVPARPGTYTLYCKPHTSDPERPEPDDMAATLVVT